MRICLVIKDELIRSAKWMPLPRRATFKDVKHVIQNSYSIFKDLPLSSIRLWVIHANTTSNEFRFIDEYNSQLQKKLLPNKLVFPGVSYELSLDYTIEDYPSFNRTKELLFVEIKKQRHRDWLFDIDERDAKFFEPAAVLKQSGSSDINLPTQDV